MKTIESRNLVTIMIVSNSLPLQAAAVRDSSSDSSSSSSSDAASSSSEDSSDEERKKKAAKKVNKPGLLTIVDLVDYPTPKS